MSTSAYRRRYHKDAGAGSYAGIPGCNKIHAGTWSEAGAGNYKLEINGTGIWESLKIL